MNIEKNVFAGQTPINEGANKSNSDVLTGFQELVEIAERLKGASLDGTTKCCATGTCD